MSSLPVRVCFAVLLALMGGAALAQTDPVARFAWMQGCWVDTANPEAGNGEHWMAAAGGTVIGVSRTVKDGKTTAYELLQIREVDGKLAYIATPSGRPPTTFTLLRESASEWVFENLGHDFPQRIIYRREGDALLFARIEGNAKGKLKGIDFPMRRTSCETK